MKPEKLEKRLDRIHDKYFPAEKPDSGQPKFETLEEHNETPYMKIKRLESALASSEANIQKAYEQGVKDAIVDGRNESEAKDKEALEQEIARLTRELEPLKRDSPRLKERIRELFEDCERLNGIMQKSDKFRSNMVEENIRLKKENSEIRDSVRKNYLWQSETKKAVQQALSELRDETKAVPNPYLNPMSRSAFELMRNNILKAIFLVQSNPRRERRKDEVHKRHEGEEVHLHSQGV